MHPLMFLETAYLFDSHGMQRGVVSSTMYISCTTLEVVVCPLDVESIYLRVFKCCSVNGYFQVVRGRKSF
jgi:hypothetical protein